MPLHHQLYVLNYLNIYIKKFKIKILQKPHVKLWINNREVESKATEFIDLYNPATNELIALVPKTTQSEMETAVQSCKEAFKSWSKTTPLFRQQIMFKLQALIKDNLKDIAKNITKEQGKTWPDAEGDVLRGLQVVEHACSLTFMQMGTTLPGIAKDMDCASYRVPLGVTAGITVSLYSLFYHYSN
jgi:malonate-semialdehyde dehydrogenase (acetylating)/methylmalonate-semialdehyde dehydrogenase